MFEHPEHQYLYETALSTGKGPFLEVGCFKGESTRAIAQAAKELNTTLYCVDPFFGYYDAGLLQVLGGCQGQCSSFLDFKINLNGLHEYVIPIATTFDRAYGLLPRFTFIHIDASHDEASVRNDVRLALTLSNTGTILLFHDGAWASVSKPVKEVFPHATFEAGAFLKVTCQLPFYH